MSFKEQMEKFNSFLTDFGEKCGAKDLCESVREAAKVCFEGDFETVYDDVKQCLPYKDIHHKMFKGRALDILKAKRAARQAAEKAAESGVEYNAADRVGTDAPKDECAGAECAAQAQTEEQV